MTTDTQPGSSQLTTARRAMLDRLHRDRTPYARTPVARSAARWVPIRTEGDRPPMLCVPPVSGSVYWSLSLAHTVPADQPMYAFEAAGVSDGAPMATVTEMAAAFVALIRAAGVPAIGALVGYSMGGTVAYEIAVQLAAVGTHVPVVVMIDSEHPAVREPSNDADVVRQFVTDFALQLDLPTIDVPIAHLLAAPDADTAKIRLHAVLADAGMLKPGIDADFIWRRFLVFRAHMRALQVYDPPPYAGRVSFIGVDGSAEAAQAWRARATSGLECRWVDGNHYSMWSPSNRVAVGAAVESIVAGDLSRAHPDIPI